MTHQIPKFDIMAKNKIVYSDSFPEATKIIIRGRKMKLTCQFFFKKWKGVFLVDPSIS